MKKFVSIHLILALLFVVLPGKSFAWPPSSAGVDQFFSVVYAAIIVGVIASWGAYMVQHNNPEGWIAANICGTKRKETPPKYIHIINKEGGFVYKNPENDPIGYVYLGESFEVKETKNTINNLWYKIKFSKDRLLK